MAMPRKRQKGIAGPKRRSDYELLRDLVSVEGTTFPEHLREELFNPRDKKGGEGPGERIYRRTYGLDESLVGSPKGPDVPEHGGKELKGVYASVRRKPTRAHPDGRSVPSLAHFRAGQHASDVCKRVITGVGLRLVQERFARLANQFLPADQRREFEPDVAWERLLVLVTGSLSGRQRALLPRWASDMIRDGIKPSVSLADYAGGIGCCIPEGHLDVPPADYDEAFTVDSVSKGLVSYKLARPYLERRYASALARAAERVPDGGAVEPHGQAADERQAVAVRQV